MDLTLAVWFSPAFPIGAFAYSHGIEWAHEAGDVHDAASLREWLLCLCERGALANDAILLAHSFAAARGQDAPKLTELNELALALATSRERTLETATQGNAFLRAIEQSWPAAGLDVLPHEPGEDVAFPVAVGVAAAAHDLALDQTLAMFCLGFVSNLVSAAIRLGVVGQSDGQRVIAALLPSVRASARSAGRSTPDDLGTSAFRSDLASLRHETQYTRLFRS